MGTTYAIADLHGRHDLLMAALHSIRDRDYDLGRPGGLIVFTGDYVDRGPASRQIIETLMAGPDPVFGDDGGFRFVCLRGNHEDMMVETLRAPLHPDWWIGNGGGATLVSYWHPQRGHYDASVVPDSHVEWIKALPRMHVDDYRVFVHAGVVDGVPLDEQTEKTTQWMLYPAGANVGHGERHVVHGHEQFEDGPKLYPRRTDLDTFAWATGRLVVGVFDDETPGGPQDLIEVIGKPDPRTIGWFASKVSAA